MYKRLIVVSFLLGSPMLACAEVSVRVDLSVFPDLVQVPGYPVYYAPQLDSNYFFYDGLYWLLQDDSWYTSSWYNGPWSYTEPARVPVFVLRVPVRYYRNPPLYFRGWQATEPPHWGQHWGRDWESRRRGWDQWDHRSMPPPAPLPTFQQQYSGARYPHAEQQHALQQQNYRYQPHDRVVQQQLTRSLPLPPPATAPGFPQHNVPGTPAQQRPERPQPHANPPMQSGSPNAQFAPQPQPQRKPDSERGRARDDGRNDAADRPPRTVPPRVVPPAMPAHVDRQPAAPAPMPVPAPPVHESRSGPDRQQSQPQRRPERPDDGKPNEERKSRDERR